MTDDQKKLIKYYTDQGYHVQLDPNDDILMLYYWHPELIVSRIWPENYKKEQK